MSDNRQANPRAVDRELGRQDRQEAEHAEPWPRGTQVLVTGEDFEPYKGVIATSYYKLGSGKLRYVVEDRGRSFIQRPQQLRRRT